MTDKLAFNYDIIRNVKTRGAAQRHAEAIHELIRQTTTGIVDIGRRLHEVRANMNARNWQAWLQAEFRWSQSTASHYMRIAEKFGHLDCLDNFQHSALTELTKGRVDPRAVDDAVKAAESGETVTRKRALELASKYATPDTPAAKPDALYHLRTALNKLSDTLDALLKTMQRDDVNALADDLLEFALKLRKAAAPEKPKRKPAARRTRKSSKSAA